MTPLPDGQAHYHSVVVQKQPTGASTTAAASCSATTTSAGLCGSTGSQIGAGGCVSPSAGGQNGAGGGGVGAPGSYGEGRECLRAMSDQLMLPPLFANGRVRSDPPAAQT